MQDTYNPQQIETADRMMNAIAKIPAQKQPLFATMMECMLAGSDMAKMGEDCKPPLQDSGQNAERPSA